MVFVWGGARGRCVTVSGVGDTLYAQCNLAGRLNCLFMGVWVGSVPRRATNPDSVDTLSPALPDLCYL